MSVDAATVRPAPELSGLELELGAGAPARSWTRRLRHFYRDPKAVFATLVLGTFVFIAIMAPILAPYPVNAQNAYESLQHPSAAHFFGTDRLGRDVFTRMMYGTRISVLVGFIAVSLAAGIGVPLGLLAGYLGGWIDELLMRFVDAWIAFPNLILVIALVSILGPGVVNVMIAIGLNAFPVYARLVRGQTLTVKERDFVQAVRSLGASSRRIAFRHILPNTIQPVIVQASLLMGSAILAEAGLSFLGIGIKPPQPTWGVTIQEGFPWIRQNPWPSIIPGIAIVLFTLSTNFMGDRLRDVLDPRLRGVR
jgi:peptide/nickel transport system permease protein